MLIGNETFELFYNSFYGVVFLIIFLSALSYDRNGSSNALNLFLRLVSVVVTVCFILLIGFRDYDVGTDTISYYLYNWVIEKQSELNLEIIFDQLITLTKYLDLSFSAFLILIAFLFYANIHRALINIGQFFKVNVFFLFFVFISLFFAKSLAINVIRQGLSLSFLILGYSMWLNNKSFRSYILVLILAILTHSTAVIPILVFIISIYLERKVKMKYFYLVFIIGIIMSFFNLGILSFATFLEDALADSSRIGYITGESDLYTVGFKPQFVVFNGFFLILSYFVQKRILKNNLTVLYGYKIISIYFILTSFIFFMMFQIPYSDRFGLFSWFAIPVLAAPLFDYNRTIFKYKTPSVLLFLIIYVFFSVYGSSK